MLRTTTETDTAILGFFGKYRPLSNFHQETFIWEGMSWATSEHAFHAAKTKDPTWIVMIQKADTPSSAKRYGRQCPLRADWETVKDDIMYSILFAKFTQSQFLKELLLSTGEKYLEETNDWGDTHWGRDVEKGGLNRLGEILMRIRKELKENVVTRGLISE